MVVVALCLFIYIDWKIYLYCCSSSKEDPDEDHRRENENDEESHELAPMSTSNDAHNAQYLEDVESKGYGSTEIAEVAAETSESSNWSSFITSFIPFVESGDGNDETKGTQGPSGGCESELPELQTFIQSQYIPQTEDSGKNDSASSSSSSSPTRRSRRSSLPTPSSDKRGVNRRGSMPTGGSPERRESRRVSMTSPEEKARRAILYTAAYEELQQLFRTKTRLFFKALHPPGLKVRENKELSSSETKILTYGTIFEVKDMGLTKRSKIVYTLICFMYIYVSSFG